MTEALKKISLIISIFVAISTGLAGIANYTYDMGYKVGTAESSKSSILDLMKGAADCGDRIDDVKDKLFDCRSKCK